VSREVLSPLLSRNCLCMSFISVRQSVQVIRQVVQCSLACPAQVVDFSRLDWQKPAIPPSPPKIESQSVPRRLARHPESPGFPCVPGLFCSWTLRNSSCHPSFLESYSNSAYRSCPSCASIYIPENPAESPEGIRRADGLPSFCAQGQRSFFEPEGELHNRFSHPFACGWMCVVAHLDLWYGLCAMNGSQATRLNGRAASPRRTQAGSTTGSLDWQQQRPQLSLAGVT
jgi:hypothetical protein